MRSWKKTRQDWHQHRHQIHPHSIRSEQAGSDKLKPLEIRPWPSLFGASVCPVSKTGLILSLLGGYLGPGSFLWNAVGILPASCLCVPWEQERLKAMEKCWEGKQVTRHQAGAHSPSPSSRATTLPTPYLRRVCLVLPWRHLLFES